VAGATAEEDRDMINARSDGEEVHWQPAGLRFRPVRFAVSWLVAAVSVAAAAAIVPGVALEQAGAGVLVAAFIAVLNAVPPPILAALRLPFMLLIGFMLVLWADAVVLLLAHEIFGAPGMIRGDF
jgi:uncharacterized membrane protein YvlD (DUF360 family)